jgi:glucose-6-phosphate dehydrogenase assembly protein OpcA
MSLHVDSVANVSAILAELCRARGDATGDAPGSSICSTMNFIVFVDAPVHREWVLERAARLVEKHPARTIVLDASGATRGVEISTSTRQADDAALLGERVDAGVAGLEPSAILSIARELSLADIPTILWWSGARLLASRTFQGLAEMASVVVVDSSGMARDEETIRELGQFVLKYPNVTLHDMAFLRLAPWQDMIAQFFDDPALRDDLFSIAALEIESGSEAEALYLGGWLGSRISWQAIDATTFRARDGRVIRFTRAQKGDKRRVMRVTLESDDSRYSAVLSTDDENVVCLKVDGAKAKPAWWAPLHHIDNASLIERAILTTTRDPIFETSLETVRDLLG